MRFFGSASLPRSREKLRTNPLNADSGLLKGEEDVFAHSDLRNNVREECKRTGRDVNAAEICATPNLKVLGVLKL